MSRPLFLVCLRATQTARALFGAGAVPFPRSVPAGIWARNFLVTRRAKADGTLGRGKAEDHEDVKGSLQPCEDEDKAAKEKDDVEEATTEVSRKKAVDEAASAQTADPVEDAKQDEQLQKTVQETEEIKEDKGFDESTEKDTFSQKCFDMAVKKWEGAQKDLEGAREDRDFARQRLRLAVQNRNQKEIKEATEAFNKAESKVDTAKEEAERAEKEAKKANEELEKAKSTAPLQVPDTSRRWISLRGSGLRTTCCWLASPFTGPLESCNGRSSLQRSSSESSLQYS